MKSTSSLKSALVVVGGSIAAAPASALELGEVKIHSSLGQPLRASISYALGPNEALSSDCVTLQPATPGGGLPSVDKGSMIVTDGVIAITGSAVVREPMVTMRLSVRCQYTPQLIRDYLLFIDPAEPQGAPIPAPTAAQVASQPQLAQTLVIRQSAPARRQPVTRTPIENASRYQVQPGDSLSEIVQRIENRPVGLWTAVNAIFAANPDAFLDNDPNKLQAGSWLTIPDFGADAPLAVVATPAAPTAATADPVAAEPDIPVITSSVYQPESIPMPSPAVAEPVAAVTATAEPLAELQPGDVITNSDNPAVESVVIPDTQVEGPATSSSSPNVPVAIIRPAAVEQASGSRNWLLWLGGTGIALILGLLLFGRRVFDRFGSTPDARAMPQRRATDTQTANVEAFAEPDYDIDDDSPTAENLALDADLIIGSGLQEGAQVDVASDFAFASTTELDIELTEEMVAEEEQPETDIIPPMNIDESSILESEVLPEDDEHEEDDEYDMSVIVDATKMPDPADVTERDLEAIAVDHDDETLITGDYTVSQEVDYKILEQDYEDELTATQALNAEIQKAAEDLASQMGEVEAAGDDTAEKPLATVHELDVTAPLPRGEATEVIDDDDDTGVNPTVKVKKKGGKAG
ncbi:MAG: hypothetical protein QNJ23_00315 [Woeseiaceae bacterium]|nr:hypothetical protein [Woeseiaceae bacterium]